MKYLQKSLFTFYLLLLVGIATNSYSRGMQIFDGPPTTPQCQNCHYDLERFPMLGLYLGLRNPDRHHLLIGTTIPPISRSKAPDAIGAKNEGETYNCFSCHLLMPETASALSEEFQIVEPFRDCLQCHPAWIVTGGMGGRMGSRRGGTTADGIISEIDNVHMDRNPLFVQRQCRVCHSRGGMGRR